MRVFRNIMTVVLAYHAICSAAVPLPNFVVPSDDLARIQLDSAEVTFMPNGAFVVQRQGKYVADGGLTFYEPGWKRWGAQIRRSIGSDLREFDKAQHKLTCRGTLKDTQKVDALLFDEEVRVVPHGLRFTYEVRAPKPTKFAHLGASFTLPIAVHTGKRLEYRPGFRHIGIGFM